jgi:hypothetical protein
MSPATTTLARLDRAIDDATRHGRYELANMLRCERADLRLMMLEPAGTARLLGVIGGRS